MSLKKKEVLEEISKEASLVVEKEVTPKVTEAVLEATATVVKRELLVNDEKASITIPHIGTFKPRFVEGGMKEVRNVATGEKFSKEVADRHKLIIKLEKKFQRDFDEEKGKVFKKKK